MPWIKFKCRNCTKEFNDFLFLEKEKNPFYPGNEIWKASVEDTVVACPYCENSIREEIELGLTERPLESGDDDYYLNGEDVIGGESGNS